MNKEKVRELACLLKSRDTGSSDSKCKIITEWLEQNPVEPVVVGLSDEQVRDLAGVVSSVDYDDFHTTRYDVLIQNYLKTQTFTQPAEYTKSTIDRLTTEIKQCYDVIRQLKSQQFQPNWDDAPTHAVLARVVVEYLREDGYSSVHANKVLAQFERPKPTPQVEVGQVWKGEGIKVKVGCLGRVSKNGEESIAFVDVDTNELKTWLLKTFLAKFELTGEQK